MNRTTQQQKIAAYIDEHGSITPMQAFADLNITKLATRISEMRRKGYNVDIRMVYTNNAAGEPVRFAKYSKAGE